MSSSVPGEVAQGAILADMRGQRRDLCKKEGRRGGPWSFEGRTDKSGGQLLSPIPNLCTRGVDILSPPPSGAAGGSLSSATNCSGPKAPLAPPHQPTAPVTSSSKVEHRSRSTSCWLLGFSDPQRQSPGVLSMAPEKLRIQAPPWSVLPRASAGLLPPLTHSSTFQILVLAPCQTVTAPHLPPGRVPQEREGIPTA